MNASRISVVVATYNRCESLSKSLRCLDEQTVSGFEVVVVSDGSSDNTINMLKEYKAHNFSLRVIDKPNEGRSLSRNLGAKQASGKLLVFFDDDMRPLPQCLASHMAVVEKGENIISVGTQEEDTTLARTDFDFFRQFVVAQWDRKLIRESGNSLPYLTSANFSITKDAFEGLYGFDKRAEVSEDFDLGYRASRSGMRVIYNSDARAWHDSPVDCATYIRKQIEHYRSYINIPSIHPELAQRITKYKPGPLKRLIYKAISWQFLIPLIDRGFFRNKLPQSIRFKFYDVLVTGLSKVCPERYNLQKINYHG